MHFVFKFYFKFSKICIFVHKYVGECNVCLFITFLVILIFLIFSLAPAGWEGNLSSVKIICQWKCSGVIFAMIIILNVILNLMES